MPRPRSIWDQVNQPVDFRFPGWEDVVGYKRVFHLVGFQEVCLTLGFGRLMDFAHNRGRVPTKAIIDDLPDEVPAAWRKEFQLSTTQGKDWLEFADVQIKAAYRRKPLLLSKCFFVLLFLEAALKHLAKNNPSLQRSNPGIDVYDIIRIEPAVFWVQGFDRDFYREHIMGPQRHEAIRELQRISGQNTPRIFADIAMNRKTCTHATASAITTVFKSHPEISNEVSYRVSGARDMSNATQLERPIFSRKIPLIEGQA